MNRVQELMDENVDQMPTCQYRGSRGDTRPRCTPRTLARVPMRGADNLRGGVRPVTGYPSSPKKVEKKLIREKSDQSIYRSMWERKLALGWRAKKRRGGRRRGGLVIFCRTRGEPLPLRGWFDG